MENHGLSLVLVEMVLIGMEAFAAFIRASVKLSVASSTSQSKSLSQFVPISSLVSLSVSV